MVVQRSTNQAATAATAAGQPVRASAASATMAEAAPPRGARHVGWDGRRVAARMHRLRASKPTAPPKRRVVR